MDISEGYLDPLVGRDVHAYDSGHLVVLLARTANVLKLNLITPVGNTTRPTADRLYPRDRSVHYFLAAGLI
jgi:hypothetical protein